MTATDLSTRERDVLQHLAAGISNAEIGQAMYLSEDTVKTHLARAFRKLRVADRTGAVVRALQLGVITVPGLRPDDDPTLLRDRAPGQWVWQHADGNPNRPAVRLVADDYCARLLVNAWNDGKPLSPDVHARALERATRALQRLVGTAEAGGGAR